MSRVESDKNVQIRLKKDPPMPHFVVFIATAICAFFKYRKIRVDDLNVITIIKTRPFYLYNRELLFY